MQIIYRYLSVHVLTPNDVAGIANLKALLSPTAPKITEEDVIVTLNAGHKIFVAYPEMTGVGEPVGMGILETRVLWGRKKYWIEDVYVCESARRQGIARKLSLGLIDMARREGAAKVYLSSRPGRKNARDLYESLGFNSTSDVFTLVLSQ